MRSPVIRRTTLLGTALFTAAALSLTACGGGGSGGGNSKTVTIWSSVDAARPGGLEKALVAKLKSQGEDITINWQKVENINQLIITKIQAGDTPDIALVPQPGVVSQMHALDAIKPLDDAVDMNSLKSTMVPGTLEAGTIDNSLYGLHGQRQRQGPGLLPEEGMGQCRLQGPRLDPGAGGPDQPDQVRRRHPVVHGHRVRHGDRLAGH